MENLRPQIAKGVEILRQGGVIAFPTDTVYGLGADAFNPAAVERIYDIKGRARDRQLPLLIADAETLATLASPMPGLAWFLARRFWPGGLTLVLHKADSLPAHLAHGPTIAVRVPNHHVPLALIERLKGPITGTRANPSGQPAVHTADQVQRQLGGRIDLIVDGGRCRGGTESTVVDLSGGSPAVLRQGIIPAHEIEKSYREYLELDGPRGVLPRRAGPL